MVCTTLSKSSWLSRSNQTPLLTPLGSCWIAASDGLCTATLRADENLSEFDIGKDIGKQFGSQNVAVRYVVTDGDARSAEGVRAGMSVAGMPCEQVDRQADTTHLEQALFRNVIKATFSARMFPGATAATRKEQRKMFALDVKVGCHRIHSDMHRMYNGNVTKVASLMPRVIETTLDCYGGDCKKCRYSSVVCSGGKGNWWKKINVPANR